MPVTKSYTAKAKARRLAAAAAAISRARATLINARRSTALGPPRTGGFYGLYTRRGREELKVIDTAQITSPILTAATTILQNGVAQGTDFTNRIGRKVIIKSIHAKYFLEPLSSADGAQGDIIRYMLVWDYQANGALAAASDILTTTDTLSGVNLTNRDRFKVLYDKRHTMEAVDYNAGTITGGNSRPIFAQKYIKCNMPMIFGGTAATIGSIQTGSLVLLVLSANSSTAWACASNIRVRFSDA